MAAVTLAKTLDMPRNEWLDWRRKGIGGSDAAVIAGLNKWKSPAALWLEKTGQIVPEEPGEAAYWGQILEDIVAKEFAKQTDLKVQRRNAILQHPDYPFMIANIDRLIVGKKEGLECKTASEYRKEDWQGDKVPDEYIIQCQHYMAVTGYEAWWIAVLIGGNKFVYKRIERDEEIINCLIKLESEFWRMVKEKTPPPMDGSDSSRDVLNILYPKATKKDVLVLDNTDIEVLLAEFDYAKAQEEEWRLKKEEAQNRICAFLGEYERAEYKNWRIFWSNVAGRKSIDTKALEKEMPEVYKKYLKVGKPSRQFSVKKEE